MSNGDTSTRHLGATASALFQQESFQLDDVISAHPVTRSLRPDQARRESSHVCDEQSRIAFGSAAQRALEMTTV
jgi:hypothetical protein